MMKDFEWVEWTSAAWASGQELPAALEQQADTNRIYHRVSGQ